MGFVAIGYFGGEHEPACTIRRSTRHVALLVTRVFATSSASPQRMMVYTEISCSSEAFLQSNTTSCWQAYDTRRVVLPAALLSSCYTFWFHTRWPSDFCNPVPQREQASASFGLTCTVRLLIHVLRQQTFFFSSLLSAVTVDLPRPCLVRTRIA